MNVGPNQKFVLLKLHNQKSCIIMFLVFHVDPVLRLLYADEKG